MREGERGWGTRPGQRGDQGTLEVVLLRVLPVKVVKGIEGQDTQKPDLWKVCHHAVQIQ